MRKLTRRKTLSLFMVVLMVVVSLHAFNGHFVSGETLQPIQDWFLDGDWNYDNRGIGLAYADEAGVFSATKKDSNLTAANEYRELSFYVNSGSFDLSDDFEGALYFSNTSENSPVGNGPSLRWNKDGFRICNSVGETFHSFSDITPNDTWAPNQWYYVYLYVNVSAPNCRMAMNIFNASYNNGVFSHDTAVIDHMGWTPENDKFLSELVTNGGYLHLTSNAVDLNGSVTPYNTRVADLTLHLGGETKLFPAPILATGFNLSYSVGSEINAGDSGTMTATVIPPEATNPHINLSVDNSGSVFDRFTINKDVISFNAVSGGTATITAYASGSLVGSKDITIKGAVIPNLVKIVNSRSTDIMEIGESGTLSVSGGTVSSWNEVGGAISINSADGKYTGIKVGTSEVTANLSNGTTKKVYLSVNGKSNAAGFVANKGKWNNDESKLYVTDFEGSSKAVISSSSNGYSFGEYEYHFYSGSFSGQEDYSGALYFANLSGTNPDGNGNSIRFGKSGIALCDSEGNVKSNLTEKHETLKNGWHENSWYKMTVFLLNGDGGNWFAFRITPATYHAGTEEFLLGNEIGFFWENTVPWVTMTAEMEQTSGFVHVAIAKDSGIKMYDFKISGYGTPSFPAEVPFKVNLSDENVKWNGDSATLDVAANGSGDIQFIMMNPKLASYPAMKVENISGNGGMTVSYNGTGIHYTNSGTGTGTVTLRIGYHPDSPDNTGRMITLNLIQKIAATAIEITGAPTKPIGRGAVGKLSANITPVSATGKVKWSSAGLSVNVDEYGNYIAVGCGKSTITATLDGVSNRVDIEVSSVSEIPGMGSTSGVWANSPTGLYVVSGENEWATISSKSNEYSQSDYKFNLFTGAMDKATYEGRMYFMNKSADTPQGNGCYLSWDKNGIYLRDSKGNIVVNWGEENSTIKEQWKPNTWYSISLCLLADKQTAMIMSVLEYNPVNDSYDTVMKLNNGNPYWANYPNVLKWDTMDRDMSQTNGYVHFMLNKADGKYYDARIENLELPRGSEAPFQMTYIRAELEIDGKPAEWSADHDTVRVPLSPDVNGDMVFLISNYERATSPMVKVLSVESDGINVAEKDDNTITYNAGANGRAVVKLLMEYSVNETGEIYGGEIVTVNLEVTVLATSVEIDSPPANLAFGDIGKLNYKIEPANATSKPVWSLVSGKGVSIDKEGNYVAVLAGQATLRISVDGFTDEVTINVSARTVVSDIQISGVPEKSIRVGDTGTIIATTTPASAYDNVVRITVVRGKSIEIDTVTGQYKAVKKGETLIRFYADGKHKEQLITVN